MLVLLKHQDQVMALEVDDVTADRLKRLSLGAPVRVTFQGGIRTHIGVPAQLFRWRSTSLSARRRILPDAVLGRSVRNVISLGYL